MMTVLESANLPNSCQHTIKTPRGDYLIQITWPLCWTSDRGPPKDDPPVSTLYLVDGNAYFTTAADITRRLEFTDTSRCIVVGIGYPPSQYVYDWRRGPDLTPPTPDKKYDMPLDQDGNPRTDFAVGEADQFLAVIEGQVVPFVEDTIFPHLPQLKSARKALFGHSYGGLFALNVLFTRPGMFDFVIAASPSIAFNNGSVVKYQEADFCKAVEDGEYDGDNKVPSLMLTWGSSADEMVQDHDMSDKAFENVKSNAEEQDCGPNARAMAERLSDCKGVGNIWTRYFEAEDHGSAAVVGMQRGVMKFLVES